ncbi:hypothetical protein EIN_201220 [Entamoeba invadens IP1]|nr:hypothetical protein EIN_201220 [Entamoeba invadens IP1]ELP89627.1 hypothetical protein EIN_201220 [Entamoeba invadens IP1]|eukprot:XP_004256398.1 hypothetical protein EIN_201220 [Entamoeba invadens IP1]
MFVDCVNFTSVVLSRNVVKISYCCFVNCFNLKTIELPTSVTKISERCFEGCVLLTSISCNTNVILGSKCFCSCDSLVSIPQTKYFRNPVLNGVPHNLKLHSLMDLRQSHIALSLGVIN